MKLGDVISTLALFATMGFIGVWVIVMLTGGW